MIETFAQSAVKKAPADRAGWARGLRNHAGWVVSLLLVGLGAKLWFILRSATPLPYDDQWDAEATKLYIPYFGGHLSLADLFSGHGQHRIFFTRLCNLGLLLLNGQWDNQLEAVFNAIVHSLGMAGFGLLMAKLMGKKFWPLLWLPLALALVLPFAWENTLWGFQSQFYFLLFLSLLTIWLLGLGEPLSIRWWFGVVTAVAALFTMASGFVAVAVVAALALLDIVKQKSLWRRHLPTLVVCTVIAGAGLLSKPWFDKGYEFNATSIGALVASFSKIMAWPWISMPWFALCNLLPLALFGWVYFRSKAEHSPAEKMVLGVSIWILAQALGLAYARGAGGNAPVSRYMDVCSFVMIADCLCILMLLSRWRPKFRLLMPVVFGLWTLGCSAGLWRLCDRYLRVEIPDLELCQRLRLESMRAFMVTDDVKRLQLAEDCNYVPIAKQAKLLRDPYIRRILPTCVRDSLNVVRKDQDPAFVQNGFQLTAAEPPTETSWGSFSVGGATARGGFESMPVKKSSFPFLEIPVAGGLGEAGLSLELIDLATGKTTAVKPPQIPGGRWLNVYVKAPAGEFKMVARDESDTQWFAFKEPRECGRLSLWAMQILAAWKYILAIGLGCLFLNLVLMILGFRSVSRS